MPHTLNDKSDHGSFARRQKVADAAIKLFEKNGVAETTIEEITNLAGVSERTFFRYFSSKEATLFAHHHRLVDSLTQALDNRKPSSTPFDSVLDVVKSLSTTILEPQDKIRYKLIYSDRQLMDMSRIGDTDYENAIESYLRSQIPGDSFDHVVQRMFAVSTVSLIRSITVVWNSDENIDLPKLLDQGMSLLSRAFSPNENKYLESNSEQDIVILVPRRSETQKMLNSILDTASTYRHVT